MISLIENMRAAGSRVTNGFTSSDITQLLQANWLPVTTRTPIQRFTGTHRNHAADCLGNTKRLFGQRDSFLRLRTGRPVAFGSQAGKFRQQVEQASLIEHVDEDRRENRCVPHASTSAILEL